MEIRLVVPKGFMGRGSEDSAVETRLRDIALCHATDPRRSWTDPERYGICWNDERFWMMYDCQDDADDCWLCGLHRCGCGEPYKVRYFVDGRELPDRQAYDAWNRALLGPLPFDAGLKRGTPAYKAYEKEWNRRAEERDRRSLVQHPAVIHSCYWKDLYVDRPKPGPNEFPYPHSAPNFWLKSTGFKVWWYKYIGRETEFNRNPTEADFAAMDALIDRDKLAAIQAKRGR